MYESIANTIGIVECKSKSSKNYEYCSLNLREFVPLLLRIFKVCTKKTDLLNLPSNKLFYLSITISDEINMDKRTRRMIHKRMFITEH